MLRSNEWPLTKFEIRSWLATQRQEPIMQWESGIDEVTGDWCLNIVMWKWENFGQAERERRMFELSGLIFIEQQIVDWGSHWPKRITMWHWKRSTERFYYIGNVKTI